MILRNRLHTPSALFTAGMTCLATGLVAQQFIHPTTDFWQGVVTGLSVALFGASIVFNVRGLVLRRKHRENGG